MAVFWVTLLFSMLLVCTNCQVAKFNKNGDVPASVDSRFFGLGGLGEIINSLLPGFNLGNQGGFGRNPSGMDFPANSQFYPNTPIQDPRNPGSSGQGSAWPVLDDASKFPNQGENLGAQQSHYPSQWNAGGSQYPTQVNMWGYPPYSQGNIGKAPKNTMYPQYPNQGGFPNQQYPNQQEPSQGNFGGIQSQSPSYPINSGGNPMQNQFPNQGGNWNQYPNNFDPGTGQDGGTLDSIVPPTNPQDPSDTDVPNTFSPGGTDNAPTDPEQPNENPSDGNPILGKPVQVSPDNMEPGQITYPNSTDTASRRQCVQDCQTTTEYNPVCGSDNITYINPGKFVCARNCGNNVFVAHKGRCSQDTAGFPTNT